MKTRAAIAWKAAEPLSIAEVDLEGPRAGEVLVEIKATGICHTDYYTLSGADPEGIFPAILGAAPGVGGCGNAWTMTSAGGTRWRR
jgi:S-(hydroxymethyl)glutathione dehydrogenase/alcohol dehydrogenase